MYGCGMAQGMKARSSPSVVATSDSGLLEQLGERVPGGALDQGRPVAVGEEGRGRALGEGAFCALGGIGLRLLSVLHQSEVSLQHEAAPRARHLAEERLVHGASSPASLEHATEGGVRGSGGSGRDLYGREAEEHAQGETGEARRAWPYWEGDYIPKSQFDRSFGLEHEGPKECLAGLLERRSRHINLFPQFFAIRLVGPLGKAHCGGFLYRVGGSLLTALHGRSVSLFCSQGHSPREPGTPCGHYSILPGEDTFLQVYGRLGIHEGVVPAEPARKNLIPHLLDRFRDSVLGSKG